MDSFSSRNGACAYMAKLAQGCSEFTHKDEWPPKLPDVNPLHYHIWGVMLEHCKTFHPKPKNTDGLKKVLQLVWDQLLRT